MDDITKKFTMTIDDENYRKCPCKNCNLETRHSVICSYIEDGSQYCGGGNSVDWRVLNQIIQCLGCEEVSFLMSSTNSEEIDYDEAGRPYHGETITYFPGRAIGPKMLNHWLLPWGVGQIYKEARSAVENELLIIGGIAIRALLESVCSDVKAKGRTLDVRIDDLHARSLVTREGVDTLHKIRILGNRAAHQAQAHSKGQLLLALEVIEHILIGTYIIPERAKDLFKSIEVGIKLLPPSADSPE